VKDRAHGHLPFFLTPPFLGGVGLTALIALAAELLLLPRLVFLDAAVWRVILLWRGCGFDHAVDLAVEATTLAMIILLAAATVLALRSAGVRATWPPLAVCAVGLHAGKVLKNVFARERPSMLPEVALGHSFPSAHVMNTGLAALAVIVLAAGFRHPRRWWAAAAVCLAIIFAGRLLVAHHWFLDAVGGALAAVALTGLCLPGFRRRPLLAPGVLAGALTVVLAVVVHDRAFGIRLPSPLTAREPATVEVGMGESWTTPLLQGGWEEPVENFRGGVLAWLRGAATVTVVLPADGSWFAAVESLPAVAARDTASTDAPPAAAAGQAVLAIAGRSDITVRRCARVRIAVNGRELPSFVPFEGWRQYRLPVPPGTLRPGPNEVRIAVADESDAPLRFALAYVRIDPD
jgi:membrane-associated phospholipid phosphatase